MTDKKPSTEKQKVNTAKEADEVAANMPKEIGGFEKRAEPTRYGDWDVNGRCSDF